MKLFNWIAPAFFVIVVGLAFWLLWYEATFDYTKCQTTEQYRDRHSSAWMQTIPGSNGMPATFIHHAARDWTERLYSCPDRKGKPFDKWRNERRPT